MCPAQPPPPYALTISSKVLFRHFMFNFLCSSFPSFEISVSSRKMGEELQPDASITSASAIDWPVAGVTFYGIAFCFFFGGGGGGDDNVSYRHYQRVRGIYVGALVEGGESHWIDLKFEILIEMEINKRNDLPKQFLSQKSH